MPSGSRLAARTRTPGASASTRSARWATASIRCSQLSSTRTRRLSASAVASRSSGRAIFRASRRNISGMPTAVSTACGTSSAPRTGASGTNHTPSGMVAARRRGGEVRPLHVGERRAAPHAERPPERLRPPCRVVLGTRRRHEPLEHDGVDVSGVHREPVSAGPRLDGVAYSRGAQPGHAGLQRVGRAGGRRAGPKIVDEALGRDRTPGVHGEPDQQGTQARTADLDGPRRRVVDVEGARMPIRTPPLSLSHRFPWRFTGGGHHAATDGYLE